MIISGLKRYTSAPFTSEEELESIVQANAEYIFGPDSIYLTKSLIRTPDGSGTIPDGIVVDLASRSWFIVEAELAAHSVWNHIAPQVAKQLIAASRDDAGRKFAEMVIHRVKENPTLKDRFDELGIPDIDIRRALSEIFATKPKVAIPIDHVSIDLQEWANTLKSEVKLWVIRKLVEIEDAKDVIYEFPNEYRPVLDTSPESVTTPSNNAYYDVEIADLVAAGLLKSDEILSMAYARRGMERRQYQATVHSNGALEVLGKSFSTPSDAALFCIKDAGSDRNTVNGWTGWRTATGKTLADLRLTLLNSSSARSSVSNSD